MNQALYPHCGFLRQSCRSIRPGMPHQRLPAKRPGLKTPSDCKYKTASLQRCPGMNLAFVQYRTFHQEDQHG